MNYGKVEERSSSRSRSPNTARRAATSAILTDILSRSDRAPTSRTADARPGKSILIVPSESSAIRTVVSQRSGSPVILDGREHRRERFHGSRHAPFGADAGVNDAQKMVCEKDNLDCLCRIVQI